MLAGTVSAMDPLPAKPDPKDELDRIGKPLSLWLDGPESNAGRVTGPARELFMDMNGRALRAGPVGVDEPMATTWDRLTDVAVPTLVMVGSLDLPHIVDRARRMADVLPEAELTVVDGAAHLPMLEQPSLVAAELLAFTAGIDP